MQEKQTKLDVLFPEREVELSDGTKVKITPLMLDDLPQVIRVLVQILQKAKDSPKAKDGKTDYTDLAISASEDVMKLFPFCLDKAPNEIPLLDAPDVIEIILAQNLTEEALGKWSALIQKLGKKLGIDVDDIVDQSKKALKKS